MGGQLREDDAGHSSCVASIGADAARIREVQGHLGAVVAHGQGIPHERDARELAGAHPVAGPAELADGGAGSGGLASVHAGARHIDHGTVRREAGTPEGPHADVGRLARPGLELGEDLHLAQHLHLEGLAQVPVVGDAGADDAAHVQQVDGVAHVQGRGHDALVALEGVAVAQGPHQDVPIVEGAHAPMGVLQLVVGGLLAPHPAGDDRPLLHQNLRRQGQRAPQPQVAGDRSELVDMDSHGCLRISCSLP